MPLCSSWWPWIFWAGTQEDCVKKELLNIDLFFFLALGIKIVVPEIHLPCWNWPRKGASSSSSPWKRKRGQWSKKLFHLTHHRSFTKTHESGPNIETTTFAKGTLQVLRNFADPTPCSCLSSHRVLAIISQSGIPRSYSVTCAIFLLSWHALPFTQATAASAKKTQN